MFGVGVCRLDFECVVSNWESLFMCDDFIDCVVEVVLVCDVVVVGVSWC